MTYKAFISYSHAADGQLAPALQYGLHRIAKPFYQLRAVGTFRDESSLHLTPELWPTIKKAISYWRVWAVELRALACQGRDVGAGSGTKGWG